MRRWAPFPRGHMGGASLAKHAHRATPVRQGRHGLRHRRPWRPVVQRRRGGRSGPGQVEEFGIETQESEAEDGEDRVGPRGAAAHLRRGRLQPGHRGGLRLRRRRWPRWPRSTPTSTSRSSTTRSPGRQHRQPGLRRGAGLVPGRRGRGAEDRDDHVGFVGGVEVPLIQKFEAGYKAGAKAVNPDIRSTSSTSPRRRTSPASTTRPRARPRPRACTTTARTSSTTPPVAPGGGVFEAASAPASWAIGVDSDQYNTADPAVQDVILTSMLKRVDVAVFDFIKAVDDGDVPGRVRRLRPHGRRRRLLHQRRLHRRHHRRLDDYKQQIIDGEIKVPTTPEPDLTSSPGSPGARTASAPRCPGPFERPGREGSPHPVRPPRRRRAAGRRRAARHHQAVPRRRRQRRHQPRRPARHDPRHRRRERRRQVDADEDPLRDAEPGRGHDPVDGAR